MRQPQANYREPAVLRGQAFEPALSELQYSEASSRQMGSYRKQTASLTMAKQTTLALVLLFCVPLRLDAQSQELAIDRGFVGLSQALDRLPFTSRVLFIAAHPDDENSGVLPYVSRGLHARTALLTLSRGEGGQNLTGPDLFEALGLIRTGEMMAAGEYYGIQQFFTRAFDFGFSNSAAETLGKWGKETVLADIVRAIRHFRPHVIISVWRGDKSDGHGHHQAAGVLAREAFQAAGDPERFSEQVKQGLLPWKPHKLYSRVGEKEQATLRVNAGQHVPIFGASYQEIASRGYSSHRSQGSGGSYSPPGAKMFEYRLVFPEGQSDGGFLDQVSVRLADLAAQADGSREERQEFSDELHQVERSIARAKENLRPSDFGGVVEPLLEGLEKVRKLRQRAREMPATPDLGFFLSESERDFEKALELSTGIYFEALADDSEVTPGQPFQATLTSVNRSSETVKIRHLPLDPRWKPRLLEGQVQPVPPKEKRSIDVSGPWVTQALAPGETLTLKLSVTVPEDAQPSSPHWSRRNKQEAAYSIPDPTRINEPLIRAPLSASIEYRVKGTALRLNRAVEHLDADPFKGARRIPLLVVPPLAVGVTPTLQLAALGPAGRKRQIQVKLSNNTPGPVSGTLSLSSPVGWSCEPQQMPFAFQKAGEENSFGFTAVSDRMPLGRASFEAVATVNSQTIDQSYRMYSVLGLWKLPLYQKAESEVVALDLKLPLKLRVAYIMGAGDRVPETLEQMGLPTKLLTAEDLVSGDLRIYDCILTGVRAYDVREDLMANNARLLEYVKRGGVLVVQYNRKEPWNRAQYAPYPAKIASNDHRVTDENAPVAILEPEHPVFNYPNKITMHDFEGWVQERGLYFVQDRDPRFRPLLASGDPGSKPLDGGLLVADYGKGKYILTSYAWFRQLPEGVPGAIRIFANLISLGRAEVGRRAATFPQRVANRQEAKRAEKESRKEVH